MEDYKIIIKKQRKKENEIQQLSKTHNLLLRAADTHSWPPH